MINRELYRGHFLRKGMTKLHCPTCCDCLLQILPSNIKIEDDSATKKYSCKRWFYFTEHTRTIFGALLTCTNPNCKEVVSCSGTGVVKCEQEHEEGESEYIEYFKPLFFYPPLNIFKIPDETPADVANSIRSSFSLVFSNPAAAANQMRISLEYLLTHLGIIKEKLCLHERINLLTEKHQTIKDKCLAIKWLGNEGSHRYDKISFDDVCDGYDIFSFVLEELYDNEYNHIKEVTKKINTKKGI